MGSVTVNVVNVVNVVNASVTVPVPSRSPSGLLWKHTDLRLNHVEVRRSRRLVISQVSTFANYEYAMYWNFYQVGFRTAMVRVCVVGDWVADIAGAGPGGVCG